MKTKRDVAMLILKNKEGKFLLQHRAEHLERWPGKWGFFGGGIDEGETPEEGFKREIWEELGYKVNNPCLLHRIEYSGVDYFGERFLFTCELDESQEFSLCSESQALGWFDIEEIKNQEKLILNKFDYENIMRLIDDVKE